jgi:hypothetical protein
MKLMITTPDLNNQDYGLDFVSLLKQSARSCPIKKHKWVEVPELADAILFVNRGIPYGESISLDRRVRQYFYKSFIYDAADRPVPLMRGIYLSLRKSRFNKRRHRSYCYLGQANEQISLVARDGLLKRDILCSFMGGATSPLRKKIFKKKLFQELEGFYIEDTSQWSNWVGDLKTRENRRRHYAEVLSRSHFVLCPKGGGPATYRMYETLEMGRVPVIVADDWVAPDGPDWNSFSLRVAERDVEKIPALLGQYRTLAPQMGIRARQAWEQWFAPEIQFHQLAEIIENLKKNSQAAPWETRTWPARLAYYHARSKVRAIARRQTLKVMSWMGRKPHTATDR